MANMEKKSAITSIEKIIPQKNIVAFAPHFDDFLFMLGGYVEGLKKSGLLNEKKFVINVLFARSNYLARTGEGNFDTSLDRIKLATGKRVIEDLECIDELLGEFNYTYMLTGEKECFTRAKPFADSEMEFPHGMYEDFDSEDRRIFERMKDRVRKWAANDDTALVFPIAIKEHIDHFIVREAGISVAGEMGRGARAVFYFQEDKPYGGIATESELARIESFVKMNNLQGMLYEHYPDRIIDLAFKHYISQVEEVYREGILNRSTALMKKYDTGCPVDIIYRYDNVSTAV